MEKQLKYMEKSLNCKENILVSSNRNKTNQIYRQKRTLNEDIVNIHLSWKRAAHIGLLGLQTNMKPIHEPCHNKDSPIRKYNMSFLVCAVEIS